MDSLSSGPGNRNSTKNLLSAVFAIAASVSGSVNAATAPTPKFVDEPAGSPKILDVAKAQQAILDMLPADHKSRPGIAAAIKSLEDGGSVQELTNLFIWAKTIVDSPMAPPAAKEKAKEIVTLLTQSEKDNTDAGSLDFNENSGTEQQGERIQKKTLPPLNEKPEDKKIRLERENTISKINKGFFDRKNWSFPGGSRIGDIRGGGKHIEAVFISKDQAVKRADLSYSAIVTKGSYEIELEYSGDGVIGYWLYDAANQQIKIDGQDRFFLKNGKNLITLPDGTKNIRFFIATTPTGPTAKITKFHIGDVTNND